MLNKRNVATLCLGAIASACFWPAAGRSQQLLTKPFPVVASFSILADIARQVGGDRIVVTSLVGPGQDAHVFQPKPANARALNEAKVILINGLGFEPFMDRLITASGSKVKPVIVSSGLPTIKASGDHNHGSSHGSSNVDPHAWQSVSNVKDYARAIATAFAAVDPENKALYETRLAGYLGELDKLDTDIRASVAKIPVERRLLVTTHDAFGYFARDYGIAFHSLQGISTDAEPSARDLAQVIRQIKTRKAPAVFLENITDPRKAERIAKETGARIGGTLYSDALSSDNGPAATYITLMRHNIKQITEALLP